jgi:hypothetical protein
MRRIAVITLVALGAAVAAAAPAVLSFDGDAADAAPAGMSFGRTGPGRPGRWVVQARARVLGIGLHDLTAAPRLNVGMAW